MTSHEAQNPRSPFWLGFLAEFCVEFLFPMDDIRHNLRRMLPLGSLHW
jgi:hypothetical protein